MSAETEKDDDLVNGPQVEIIRALFVALGAAPPVAKRGSLPREFVKDLYAFAFELLPLVDSPKIRALILALDQTMVRETVDLADLCREVHRDFSPSSTMHPPSAPAYQMAKRLMATTPITRGDWRAYAEAALFGGGFSYQEIAAMTDLDAGDAKERVRSRVNRLRDRDGGLPAFY